MSQKMTRTDTSNRKVLVLVLTLLLSQLTCDAHSMAAECCRQPSRPCKLYVLLCRAGGSALAGALTQDASAGILTLGKRGEDEVTLHSRLHQLLHGSRNQAAGILTMGKRREEKAAEQDLDWTRTLPV